MEVAGNGIVVKILQFLFHQEGLRAYIHGELFGAILSDFLVHIARNGNS